MYIRILLRFFMRHLAFMKKKGAVLSKKSAKAFFPPNNQLKGFARQTNE